MKNRIISIILAIMMIVPFASVFVTTAGAEEALTVDSYLKAEISSEEEKFEQMEPALENDNLALKIHPISGEIGIYNKVTKEIMLSNPYDVSMLGTDASKKQYLSTVILKYRSISSPTEFTYTSYNDSCAYGQMLIDKANIASNKVSVIYNFGRQEMVLPFAIHNEDLEMLFNRIRENNPDAAETRIESIKKRYNFSKNDNVWTLLGSVNARNKEVLQGWFVNDAKLTLEDMHEMYKKVNFDYTTGEIKYGSGTLANTNLGVSYQTPFTLAIDYSLTEDGFNASIDVAKVAFEDDKYVLSSISLLPYFNTAIRGESGYSFLPDGSGVLVRYEDLLASGSIDDIKTSPYGTDYGFYTVSIKNQEQTIFPVFGNVITSRPLENGFFAVIEKGDAMSTITSANETEFNSIFASFAISSSDNYDLADSFSGGSSSSNIVTVNGVERYKGEISIRYTMLTPAELGIEGTFDTSYIGMANCYRAYLQKNGILQKLDPATLDQYTRIFLEVFGSLDVEEKIMTFPVTVSKALTTFSDIISMHKSLSNYGINNMSFILTGFANGGLDNNYPTYLKWQKVLGGEDGYEELMDYAKQNGIEIAPNIDFSYSKGLKAFSGFKYKKTASKALDGRYSSRREYDASIQMFQRKGGIVISTGSYDLAYSKFLKSASEYEITSLATRALGSDLSSDFDEKNGYIFREQSKLNTQNMLGKLSGKGEGAQSNYKLILDAGNAYALKYASGLVKTPIDSSRYANTSEAVPFVGIVLHGSIEFAGDAINMEGDDKYMFLKALENGAGLYFTIAMNNTELLKGTLDYNNYYSVQFEVWKTSIVRMYSEYNSVMSSKQGSYITEHEFLNSEYGHKVIRTKDLIDKPDEEPVLLNNSRVVRVEYENGEGFILNYNSYEVQVEYNGAIYTIGALDYATYTE